MNAKQADSTAKTVVTGLMLAGAAVMSLGTIGCDQMFETQLMARSSGVANEILSQSGTIKYPELSSRITVNHNETFLTSMSA